MIFKKMEQSNEYSKSKEAHVADLTRYVLTARSVDNSEEKLLCAGTLNMLNSNEKDVKAIIAEQYALASESKRSANPLVHYVLSVHDDENERITSETTRQIAEDFIKKMGVPRHCVVYAAHQNTDNTHIHIVINRVDPETGKVTEINRGKDIYKGHETIAFLEHKYGFRSEENSLFAYDKEQNKVVSNQNYSKGVSDRGRQEEQKTGKESDERKILALKDIILKAENWQELHKQLAEHNAKYIKTAKGGAVIQIGKTKLKASSVHRDASINKMQTKLGPFQKADKEYEHKQQKFAEKPLNLFILLFACILSLLGFKLAAVKLLKAEYDRARKEYEKQGWKGQGTTLNALRSEHSKEYKQQTKEINDKFKEQKKHATQLFKNGDEKGLINIIKQSDNQDLVAYASRYEAEKLNKKEMEMNTSDKLWIKYGRNNYKEHYDAVDKYMSAMQADTYMIHSLVTKHEGNPAHYSHIIGQSKAREAGQKFEGYTSDEVQYNLWRAINYNETSTSGISVTPVSTKYHYIVIDDITKEKIEEATKDGIKFALVQETSKDNFQCIVKTEKTTDNAQLETVAGNVFAREINNKYSTTSDVQSGVHTHRLAGFNNLKRTYKTSHKVCIHECSSSICDISNARMQQIREELLKQLEAQKEQKNSGTAKIFVGTNTQTTETTTAQIEIYALHARDLTKKMGTLAGHTLDHYVAQRLAATGHAQEDIVSILMSGAQAYRPDSDKDWSNTRYAESIVRAAFKEPECTNFATKYTNMVRLWRNFEKQIVEFKRSAEDVMKTHRKKQSLSR